MSLVSSIHMPHWKENRGEKRLWKYSPFLPLYQRTMKERQKRKCFRVWGFFLFQERKVKPVENETCTASCALVQPVGTTKGQVLLVKQFHMPGPFYNIKKCYLLNKCTNMLLNLLEHSFCCISLNEKWGKWQCFLCSKSTWFAGWRGLGAFPSATLPAGMLISKVNLLGCSYRKEQDQ